MVFDKDPDAVLDYQFDWSDWLGADTIASSVLSADSGIVIEAYSNTSSAVTVWLSGGTNGATYKVTDRITTDGGRTDDRTIRIRCVEK